ncbi:MAG: GyrI-like domain-containing protein [bacterium]|nr:GyrI-like domain-containing protein [bacterium]
MSAPELIRKQVQPQLVAAVRYLGSYDEIVGRLEKLRSAAGDRVCGKAIYLFYGGLQEYGWDVELCLPVSETFAAEGLECRQLEGGEMLTITHTGPHNILPQVWERFWKLLHTGNMSVAAPPFREVRIEDEVEHGEDADKYVTEIQAASLMPVWLNRLAEGLDRVVDEETRRSIMTGSENLTEETAPTIKSCWAGEMVDRLDGAIADPTERAAIMAACAHRFPQWRIDKMRKVYEETESVDEVLYHLGRDQRWSAPHFYSPPWREGGVIYCTKIAHDAGGWLSAEDENARGASYCHCPMIKEAIRTGLRISDTYCHCGGGFYGRLWEGILGQPVEVEVIESILKGDDRCTFGIHLPEDA